MKTKTAPQISPVMQQLSSYIAAAPKKPLPKDVTEKTKHHVLDTIAAMVSGSRLLPGKKAISYIKTLGGAKEATVIGSRYVTTAINAALANGMLGHADETDDSHAPSLCHPGCAIVPAALAMAERERRNGTAILRAVALGYDVGCRINMSLNAYEFREDGHSTHSFGPMFGAAAAAGSLCNFDSRQVRHLLSYTSQQASGVSCWMRDEEHIEKAFDFGGMPARNGTAAASMVAHGFSAVEDVFAGERNFFVAYGRAPQPEVLVRELGKTYEIMNTNIKRWSVGSPIQATLDALLDHIREHTIKADDVDRATTTAVAALDESFFRVRFDRLTPQEKRYLRAMAELGAGPHRSGAIADCLKREVSSLGPLRSSLIAKGMIWSPSHGDTAFTAPRFDEFMRRIMRGEDWRA